MSEEKKETKDAEQAAENTVNEEEREGIIKLSKPYVFEGKEYTVIDITGFEKLTIGDAVKAQAQLLTEREVATALVTERTTAFARLIAAMSSEYPVEFFKLMPRGTWKRIQREVVSMLGIEEETENHVMKLHKPYSFEGKVYAEVDLSGLADMTCMNESEAENRLVNAGVVITEVTYNYLYACIMASMATGLPEKFFTGLPIKETIKLKTAVNDPDFFE